MIKTVDFGTVRIVKDRPSPLWDSFIKTIGKYEYWQLFDTGEIIAYYREE